MASITKSSPQVYWGGPWASPDWQGPGSTVMLNDNGVFSWVMFSGFSAAIAATITSATLTLGNLGTPGTGETIRVKGDSSGAGALPTILGDTYMRSLTMNYSELSIMGQTSINLDVLTILTELQSLGGDVLLFTVENVTYSGSGLSGITASLTIVYSGGGGVVVIPLRRRPLGFLRGLTQF